ncbi:hypothetical protein SAMN05421823_103230 [Catalinimonas alkaloidigena]|uniref:Uncharacterized protein n=1 Tax=Catalinimonas alkaloidigena TaxID=1075417 RepID=A0A1G9DRZ2_9BACT|nr:hypothetical protein [Catalinimonas alkaloidigena]SDK66590.1 hypothetical protein SAMN05421823_103230 [Catalinimonas alkaloidigena]
MAKLKNIIKQLSSDDYQSIYDQLMDSNAEKSAYLLKYMREKQLSDTKIMEALDVNTNAYYTLRSRLNQKIEEYLLQQMENPRTDLLKKVANISDIVFTKKRAIAIATLKKLEKELLDYDLSNELTIVYKTLKKLHINTADHFTYSQLYNRHVAYMLAVDKAEDLLAEYFKKYGEYFLSGNDIDKMRLDILKKEMNNVADLYQSHRLYVYQSCMNIFHRLFVDPSESEAHDAEPIEDVIANVQRIFDQYYLDAIYYNLKLVFEFLKLEYYNYYKVYRKAEKFFEDVNEHAATLLSNYSLYTFPAQFLFTKVDRHVRTETETELYEENKDIFEDYENDINDVPKYITYISYRAVSCFYADKYDESARWLNNMLNELSLKKYPIAQLEIKLLLSLQYCLMNDFDLFNQVSNSIQRQIRIMGKDVCEHVVLFVKILKTASSETKKNKEAKIRSLMEKMEKAQEGVSHFSPILHLKMDERFLNRLV